MAAIRGEFQPIHTNVPGIEICELFPKVAAMMDKFVGSVTPTGEYPAIASTHSIVGDDSIRNSDSQTSAILADALVRCGPFDV